MVHYIQRGYGPANLVLIHGLFGDHLDWEPVVDRLAENHRVIALDLPGFGPASPRDGEFDADRFLAALDELFDSAGLHSATLIGNSFGGQIAMLYALDRPERVENLVLLTSGGFRRYTEEQKDFLNTHLSAPILAALTPQLQELVFRTLFVNASPAADRYVARQKAKLEWPDFAAYARVMSAAIRLSLDACLLDCLQEILCPVLLLWGDRDNLIPLDEAREALPLFPNAELKVFPDCGHMPQFDHPGQFVASVAGFLRAAE